MAGIKQHHVWQLLQKGFATERHGKHYIWVHQRGSEPRLETTKNFGVEPYFYGDEDSEADVNMTAFESDAQRHVQAWRRAPDGMTVDAVTAGPIIAMIETRSRVLRNELAANSGELVAQIPFILNSAARQPEFVRWILTECEAELDDYLRRNGYPALSEPGIKEMVEVFLTKMLEQEEPEIFRDSHGMIEKSVESIGSSARLAHSKAMQIDFQTHPRLSKYSELTFHVSRTPQPFYILPDTCLAFFSGDRVRPFTTTERIDFCLLPLASDLLLIGRRQKSDLREPQVYLRALASCAYEGFISKRPTPTIRRLERLIGKNAKLISAAERKRIVRSTKTSVFKSSSK